MAEEEPYKITATALSTKQRNNLERVVGHMFKDLVYTNDLTSDTAVLVINPLDSSNQWFSSKKYQYVAIRRSDIKIVSFELILNLYEQWNKDKSKVISIHSLKTIPVFSGLTVSLCRLDEPKTLKLSTMIQANGGNVLQNLSSDSTVLITTSREGKRYDKAIEWDIPVVSPDWCFDTVLRNAVLDFKYYALVEDNGKGRRSDACDWESFNIWKLKEEAKLQTMKDRKLGSQRKRKLVDISKDQRSDDESEKEEEEVEMTVTRFDKKSKLWNSVMSKARVPSKLSQDFDKGWDEQQERDRDEDFTNDRDITSSPPSTPVELTNFAWGTTTKVKFFQDLSFSLLEYSVPEYKILSKVIQGSGGNVKPAGSEEIKDADYIVLNSKATETPDSLPLGAKTLPNLVTELYVERCIYYNKLCGVDGWCKPLLPAHPVSVKKVSGELGLIDIGKKIQVAITEFKGIELTHVEKILKTRLNALFEFNEMFNRECDMLLIGKSTKDNVGFVNEKIRLSKKWAIKIVSIDEFWDSLILQD